MTAPDPGYPYEETTDLRSGPDLHADLLDLLPLVGRWRGTGKGGYPGEEDFDFAQETTFSHDGRPVLAYETRAWVIDPDARPVRPAFREVGFFRPAGDDGFEALLVTPEGVSELFLGTVQGTKLEMSTDAVLRSPTAPEVNGEHRLYGIVDGDLLYAADLAAQGHELRPHLSARLGRF